MLREATFVRALLRPAPDLSGPAPSAPAGVPARVVLPFVTDLPVRSYLDHALPLSIVALDPHHGDAALGSFVQLFFPDDKLDYDRVLMLPSLGFREWQRLGFLEADPLDVNARALARPEALHQTLVTHLARGRYLEAQIDEFYLPRRPCHGRVHSVHDNLLFGYDLERGVFLVAGYGRDYETAEMPFADVLAAFYLMPKAQLRRRRLVAYAPRSSDGRPLDVDAVRRQLADYLGSRATVPPAELQRSPPYWKARRTTGRWGLATYAAFDEYIGRQSSSGAALDLRATRTLWEHKVCMTARLRRLESLELLAGGDRLSARYAGVEAEALAIRFDAVEYEANGRMRARADAIRAGLERMQARESDVLRQALALLEDRPCS